MKISIGMRLKKGPWGGGNQFGNSLATFLESKGLQVFFDLQEPDLDIILLCEPRTNLQVSAYSEKEIFRYLHESNSQAIVVHRINECDERKATSNVNKRLIHANLCADHTVFISTWLKKLFLAKELPCLSYSVILNGADSSIFNAEGYKLWQHSEPLRLVTHHWGGNWMKGFDIYQLIDRLLNELYWQKKVEFTYIGNLPAAFQFENVKYVNPTSGQKLASLLKQNHVYLTASLNEPAGMHHIEGAMCGLPLLYRESGALPEYSEGFGVSFGWNDFEQKLENMLETYDLWLSKMNQYSNTSEEMCREYLSLFEELLTRRDEVISNRKQQNFPKWLIKGIVNYPKNTSQYFLSRLYR